MRRILSMEVRSSTMLAIAAALVAFSAEGSLAFHSTASTNLVCTLSGLAGGRSLSPWREAATCRTRLQMHMELRTDGAVPRGQQLTPRELASKALSSAACAAVLFGSVLIPRKATASEQAEFVTISSSPRSTLSADPALVAAAAASAIAMGGSIAMAIKQEKRDVMADLQALSAECDKLNSFKEEFLEGKLSDRSIYSQLKKAEKKTNKDQKSDDDDEFERNVKAFLEERDNKDKKKKDGKQPKRPPSQNILERPGDGDDDDDTEVDSAPAEMDEVTRKMLERMMGGGDGSDEGKKK